MVDEAHPAPRAEGLIAARGRVRLLLAIGGANALVAFVHFGLASAGPVLRGGLDLGNAGLGWLLAAAPAGLMFGTFAWGQLADAIGERLTLTIAYVACGVSFLAAAAAGAAAWDAAGRETTTSGQVAALAACILVAAICGSAAHSAGGRAIVEAFPAHQHARVLAIRHTFIPLGGMVGGLVMPSLLRHVGLGASLGGVGVAALVVAGLLALLVPGRVPALLEEDVDAPVPVRGDTPLRAPRLWLLGGSCSMLALTQLALVSFLAVYLVDEAHLAAATAGVVFALSQLLGAFGRILMGDLADRVGEPMLVLVVIALVAVALVAGAVVAPAHAGGYLLAAALLVTTTWNGVAVAAAARLAPIGRTGATLGMQTTMFATMGVVAPVAVGAVLARASWTPVLAGIALVLAAGAVGLLRLRSLAEPG